MKRLASWVYSVLFAHVAWKRDPDFVIGDAPSPYLHRWFVIPRNRLFNVYLHEFLRDDDDRALHDHPWFWCSFVIRGAYIEHTIAAGGTHRRRRFSAGALRIHSPWFAHRIELDRDPHDGFTGACWTLFITGPRLRQWGFHCKQGWRHWKAFTDPANSGAIGRGCDS